MPVIPAPKTFTHELPHARFKSLATPSRGSTETAVWRVQLAPHGEAVPHQLTREEVFVVLSGRARIRLGGQELEAGEGDVIVVPPNTDFALWSTSEQPVEALCCLPVGGQARMGERVFTPPWAE
jgi:mannose-6-phosphate isomerase-like protein (cupin superfamily)